MDEDEDILTLEEEKKIEGLKVDQKIQAMKQAVIHSHENAMAAIAGMAGSRPHVPFSITRRLGLHPIVTINNISGKKAWVILSPAPISTVSSVGVEKVGQISLSSVGDYKCQQSAISNNTSREFELDNSQIYYSVFFECDGKWKTPFKDRKINTRKYNINLLERHVDDAVDSDFIPLN